jgi:ribosomal protein L20A (L18A)
MKFKVRGKFKKKGYEQIFNKEVAATRKELALDKVFALTGSNHKVKRAQIEIISVEEIKE